MPDELPPVTIKAIAGLWNSPNPFSKVPEGALDLADEVVLRANGTMESRRGYDADLAALITKVVAVTGTTVAIVRDTPGMLFRDVASLFTTGNLSVLFNNTELPPYSSDVRVSRQFFLANKTVISTMANGPQSDCYSVAAGTPGIERKAGVPRCPAPIVTLIAATGNQVMSINARRTYRVTVAWYDINNNFFESEPSEQVWVETGGTAMTPQIVLRWPLGTPGSDFASNPPNASIRPFFRIWRGVETAVGVPTNDEMFLTREFVPPLPYAIQPSFTVFLDPAATYTVNDISQDSLLNVPLYTNPQTGDGDGIFGSNARPPSAAAIAYFKGRAYYGRCSYQHTLAIQIIGTGTTGVAAGDTLTIDGITYTAGGAGLEASGIFNAPVVPGQPAQNIETTAKSLVECIRQAYCSATGAGYNRQINRQLSAYYASSDVSDFGRIVIARPLPFSNGDDPAIAFAAVTTSNGIRFPNGSASSMDDYSPGGVSWSKPNQPEAVPAINFQIVGDENHSVLGFSVHRDAMIIYKEDGAYIVRDDGSGPSFDLLDTGVICIAPASIAVVSNLAYLLCTRGVLQVSEQGTELMSFPIFEELDKLYRQNANALAIAYGIGHEGERLYILGVPASANETRCSLQYVLRIPETSNTLPVWSRWTVPGTLHGCVAPLTNQIVLVGAVIVASGTWGSLVERRGHVASLDYYDSFKGATIAAPNGSAASLVLTGDLRSSIGTGDLLSYNPGGVGTKIYTPRVIGISYASGPNQTTLTLDQTVPWAGGTFSTLPSIRCHWRFSPITGGAPTTEKQWASLQAYFAYLDGDWLDVLIDSEETPLTSFSQVYNDPQNSNLGGEIALSFPGAVLPNPSPSAAVSTIQWLRNCKDVVLRLDPAAIEARGMRLGVEMQHAQALSSFKLCAISASVNELNQKGTR